VALAIGEIVDASIVMVENAYRRLSDEGAALAAAEGAERTALRNAIIIDSAKHVGPAIFGSLLVMIASFLPVFLLTGREGKMFAPLAYTKTFAMIGASVLAITLVPALMTFFMRGRMRPESANPVSRFFTWIYAPFLRWSLRYGKTMLALNVVALLIAIPMMLSLGREFMPPLDEGSLLYMPVTLPAINITEARRIIQVQDAIIAKHPAVAYVLGKVGRAETATDPAPVSMFETIIELKPREQWPKGMTKDQIIQELDAQLQIAGVTNGWTQPIINRIDMLNTGVRTQLGIKIFGPDLNTLESLGLKAESILRTIPGAVDLYTERSSGGQYIDIAVDREAIARYGIPVGVVLDAIETAIGGTTVTTTVEGRARYPVQVRYLPDYRNDLVSLQNMLITIPQMGGASAGVSSGRAPAPSGGMSMGGSAPSFSPAPLTGATNALQLPLGQLAKITGSAGPAMINSENGQLRALVQLNVRGRDMGSFVDEAKQALDAKLQMPAGYSIQFSGQYENQVHARKRLQVLVPLVLIIIFVILYFTFQSAKEASLVMLSVPFALIGGVYLMWIYGFNWSVAVWVGFIALYGVAVQTGVVMVLYLHEALDRRIAAGGELTEETLFNATVEGALLRVRPKIMTVATTVIGLLPLLWATGTGSDVMKPIAVPLIGGMVTSTIHVLLVTPIIFLIMKRRDLRRGRLELSGLKAET
jgi:Cu(I)/Ag(I) efflux system membrane protein CusA/SilA